MKADRKYFVALAACVLSFGIMSCTEKVEVTDRGVMNFSAQIGETATKVTETSWDGDETVALKAEYARDVAPRVRAIVDSGDLTPLDNGAGPNLYVIAAAAYDYGLPGEGDLAQEDALERARETVRERFGLSQEALSRYTDVLVYFDATDPDAPLWRFVLQPEMGARDALGQAQYDLRYRVEIASRTGAVVSAEAFERQIPVYDLSYLMNLY